MFYQTEAATTCDICEGEECTEKCSPQALRQQAEKDAKSKEPDVFFKTEEVQRSNTPKLVMNALTMLFTLLCIRFF